MSASWRNLAVPVLFRAYLAFELPCREVVGWDYLTVLQLDPPDKIEGPINNTSDINKADVWVIWKISQAPREKPATRVRAATSPVVRQDTRVSRIKKYRWDIESTPGRLPQPKRIRAGPNSERGGQPSTLRLVM